MPVPDPLVVLVFKIVGPVVVDQQTPLEVIELPPSSVTFPPQTAELVVIEVTVLVETVANTGVAVVTVISFP